MNDYNQVQKNNFQKSFATQSTDCSLQKYPIFFPSSSVSFPTSNVPLQLPSEEGNEIDLTEGTVL